MAELVDEQRDDAPDTAENCRGGENRGLRTAAGGDKQEREDAERDERPPRDDDRDRPLDEHETSPLRYLKGRDSKHANCIDRNEWGLESQPGGRRQARSSPSSGVPDVVAEADRGVRPPSNPS